MSEPSAAELEDLRAQARAAIEAGRDRLIGLSHRIHAQPELGFAEIAAAQLLGDELDSAGFAVERGAYDLPTAFDARLGSGSTVVAVCVEYDALPGIGHACGHNIIAATSVGFALGLARVADRAELGIRVIGTPAEESGNATGKMLLLERGAFDGVTAAMMVHPSPFEVLTPLLIAAALFNVTYEGRASHAAFYPELGINAADAMVVSQVAIGLLRQSIGPHDRIHGIVTHGGDAHNIIPARATARYMVRSPSSDGVEALRDRVFACFEAGGTATGSRLTIEGGERPYAEVRHCMPLAQIYRRNAERLGRVFETSREVAERPFGSTDMGNVSLAVPSIHPMMSIGSWPAVNHQPEFAQHCISPDADRAVIDASIALAWTAIDLSALDDPASFLAS
jgi:amidohydrolase